MGNSSSNSRDGYGYGPPQPGHVIPNPHYYPRFYGGNPYDYVDSRMHNPLPFPPKEPLPQGPYYGHQTPFHGPEEIRERMPDDRNGSFGRKRGANIMRSLTGSIGRMMGQRAEQPLTPWTYPDGTPFPVKKAEISPMNRPRKFRSSSFSGRGKKEDLQYYLFDPFERDEANRLTRWRSLNKSERKTDREKERRASAERYNYRRPRRNDGYFDGWAGPAQDHKRSLHRRSHSETRPRGILIEDYIPPEKRDRQWFFPDGTPYPKPNEVAEAGQGDVLVPPTVTESQLPRRGTPAVIPNPLPRGPSPVPVLPSTSGSGQTQFPQPHLQPVESTSAVRIDPMSQAQPQHRPHTRHQDHPLLVMNYDPTHETQPGIPDYINPEVTFSFDRSSELCHFSYHGVVYNGRLYPTAYHLWEAMKFFETRPDLAKKIRKTERVRDVAKLVQELGEADVRRDWNNIAIQKIDETLYIKCRQHPSVSDSLAVTGHRHIIFLSQREPFWGWSTQSRSGANALGLALERVREKLLNDGAPRPPMPEWKIRELERIRIQMQQ